MYLTRHTMQIGALEKTGIAPLEWPPRHWHLRSLVVILLWPNILKPTGMLMLSTKTLMERKPKVCLTTCSTRSADKQQSQSHCSCPFCTSHSQLGISTLCSGRLPVARSAVLCTFGCPQRGLSIGLELSALVI